MEASTVRAREDVRFLLPRLNGADRWVTRSRRRRALVVWLELDGRPAFSAAEIDLGAVLVRLGIGLAEILAAVDLYFIQNPNNGLEAAWRKAQRKALEVAWQRVQAGKAGARKRSLKKAAGRECRAGRSPARARRPPAAAKRQHPPSDSGAARRGRARPVLCPQAEGAHEIGGVPAGEPGTGGEPAEGALGEGGS